MSNIRVTYSGLIALTVGFASVFTGIIFTLIVTRRLSPEDFGTWSLIGSMITYFLVVEPIISYWSTRQIARGEKIGKTSLISSSVFSLGSVPIYLLLVYFVAPSSGSELSTLLLGVLLLPVIFISQTLVGINLGHKPHATSYGLLGFEISKIPTGLVFVYFLDLGVEGAIVAIFIAYLLKISIQLYFAKSQLKERFNINTLRRWFRLAWIPIYSNISHLIWSLDVILYVSIIGSTIGVAFYAVSLSIASIITHSGLISQALYPKLISSGKQEYVKENFTRLVYFSIPLLGISIIFSKPALFALNPAYEGASAIVILIAIRTFFYVLTSVLYQVLKGIEKVDAEKNPTFSALAKSKLFQVPTLELTHYTLYVVSLTFLFIFFSNSASSELELVTWWAWVMPILQIPFFIYAWIQVRKHIKFSFPISDSLKYLGATLVFIVVFYFSADFIIVYDISIYKFLPTLLLELVICIGIYLSITLITDKKTRILFRAIFQEFKNNK